MLYNLGMNTLSFSIEIQAPKQTVWEVMLADSTYRQWTSAFHEGSYYEGSWDKGSKIRFLAPDPDGSLSGMAGQIAQNKPYEFISIEYLGEVIDGVDQTTGQEAQQWVGAHENYYFSETDGVTTLKIELDGAQEDEQMTAMFEQMWPPALRKLKDITEQAK